MQPTKTSAGLQVMKDRSVRLTPRQRAAFILVDGKRSIGELLESTAPAGVTREDVDQLFALGLITHERASATAPAQATSARAATAGTSPQERYAAAYPIAARLTGSLGLRGFRLNLAVEAATCFDDLLALAPRIREAVGDERFAPLQDVITP
ncbi:MAG TPA: hypothetical protein VHL79_09120 [Ramlibacter sp.]|jgi:hypothetical protein|nr:hypothetical protein [Ramlibacter sp.]